MSEYPCVNTDDWFMCHQYLKGDYLLEVLQAESGMYFVVGYKDYGDGLEQVYRPLDVFESVDQAKQFAFAWLDKELLHE